MSILKKIFGQKSAREWVARQPRVRLTELHRISFSMESSGSEESLGIGNISINGMSLLLKDGHRVQVGDEVCGILAVDQNKFEIKAQIRYVTQNVTGCAFLNGTPQLQRAIEQYFKVEILALKLNKVDEAFLKGDPRGQVVWFTDGKQNELYCVRDPKGLLAFHMTFLGNYVEGGRDTPVRVGFTRDDDAREEPAHKGATLLEISLANPQISLENARILVENVRDLPGDLKKELTGLLVQSK